MVQATSQPPPRSSPPAAAASATSVVLRYTLSELPEDWIIPEVEVPESAWHDRCLELFKALLVAWVETERRDAAVFRDIATYFRPDRPRLGFNPDVCLIEPAPPEPEELSSLKLWEHSPPRLAFEAVSPNHPYKDYAVVPEKCAVAGVEELVVFDPLLAGPQLQGGPHLLQLWRRQPNGEFERVSAGLKSARSEVLGAWLVPNWQARRLRIAAGPNGEGAWLTGEEQAIRREEQALRRVAELEAELRRR